MKKGKLEENPQGHSERMSKEKQYGQKFSKKLGFHSFPELMTNLSSGSLYLDFFSETFPYLKMFNQLEGQSVQKSEIMQNSASVQKSKKRRPDI